MRTATSFAPQEMAVRASRTRRRASSLASTGTLSSRSSMMTSAALAAALSCILARCPGTDSTER